MSDSDSSDDEGIPSISALVQSLVPNAPSFDSDDDESDTPDAVGKLPSSISHLVQNLVSQYDSISDDDDDDDSGNSSSDDDGDDEKKGTKPATPATTEDDDSDDDGDVGLSSLVQNILKQQAHRSSVEINSRLSPITKNIPRKRPLQTHKEETVRHKPVEPLLKAPTRTPIASTINGSRHSVGLSSTVHSVPENEEIIIPLTEQDSDRSFANKAATPASRQRRRSKSNSQIDTQRNSSLLNESSHTVISAVSTNSAFDPAELESALENKGRFNEEEDDVSMSILNDSMSSIDEFASASISTELTSGRQRKKKKAASPKRTKSSSSNASRRSASSSKNSSKKRKDSSGRRKFAKEPLSPLLGKLVGDSSPGDEVDDNVSPLPLQQPLKKKKSDSSTNNDSERSGSRSKRSRSSLSRSSHKSSKSKTKRKKEKDSSLRSVSKRSLHSIPETPVSNKKDSSTKRKSRLSLKKSIPETPASKKKDSSARSKSRRSLKNSILDTPVSKKKESSTRSKSRRSLRNSIPETPASKRKGSRVKRKSQQSQQGFIPETPSSQREGSMRSTEQPSADSFASPPVSKPRKRRSIDDAIISGRDNRTIPDPPTIPETPGASTIRSTSKRGQSKSPSTKQSSQIAADPPSGNDALSPASDKFSTRRTDEEEVEYERPLHPVGPIHMISFATLALDDDTSISSSSTEEEDLYETESSEGDNEATEYGSDVSGSQIPTSLAPEDSLPPSQSGYETDPADANEDIDNDYEDYESDKSPSANNFANNNGDDEYESDGSDSFALEDVVEEKPPPRPGRRSLLQRAPKQTDLSLDDYESDSNGSFVEDSCEPHPKTGRRTMLERSSKQTDLSLDDYESDSSDSFVDYNEEPPKKTGRRAMLERTVSSEDLSAVLDEYDLDTDSDEEDRIEEPPMRTGRRSLLERSVSSQDLSAVLDEYDLDSDSGAEDLAVESAKRDGRRAMLERTVSSQDLSAVLDEYDLDSDSASGNGEEYEPSDSESDDVYEPDNSKRNRVPEPKQKKARESWPAPGSNPRRNFLQSDASTSVDYTDSEEEEDKQQFEFASDNGESREPTQRSNRYKPVDQDGGGSSFGSDEDFEFEDDNSDESSDEDGEYSGGSGGGFSTDSGDDRNYYAKMEAVTRREDQLALRSQRLKRKICFAVCTMIVMIIGLVVLFIVDPLQKDVLSEGTRRLRGVATTEQRNNHNVEY